MCAHVLYLILENIKDNLLLGNLSVTVFNIQD